MKRFPVSLTVLIAAAIGASPAPEQSSGDFRLELNASLVSVDVRVDDVNQTAVTTLDRNDFQVYEDGVLQQVRSFTPVSGEYRILLLIDRSGSMSRYWSLLMKGLNSFMKTLRPQDQVAVAAFDEDVQLDMDWRSAPNGNMAKSKLTPDGVVTEIWRSVDWARRKVLNTTGRKGVIVFTDGEDSGNDFARAMQRAVDSAVPFYFVGMTREDSIGGARMKKFAQETGGRAFFPRNAKELDAIYTSIARDLASSYTITYSPAAAESGTQHQIEIRTVDSQLHIVQSRSSYMAK
jgi:Ca-activated chloride channel family protein